MTKLRFSFVLLLFISFSCSVEKINLSPVGSSTLQDSSLSASPSLSSQKKIIFYSSEISNLMASFPKFKNDAVNKEVGQLKFYLKDYISAVQTYNMVGIEIAQKNFEKSYKKLQRLRKFLNSDEDQILNRYLVRIKTNLSELNNNFK